MPVVVVASDAPSVRAEVKAALDGADIDVIEARSGPEVLRTVAETDVDLVVVDLQMDSMGAVAVCSELRLEASYGNLPDVPVLMLLDRRPDVFMARRAEAAGWLVKPLDPIRLRLATKAVLSGDVYHDQSYLPPTVTVEVAADSR